MDSKTDAQKAETQSTPTTPTAATSAFGQSVGENQELNNFYSEPTQEKESNYHPQLKFSDQRRCESDSRMNLRPFFGKRRTLAEKPVESRNSQVDVHDVPAGCCNLFELTCYEYNGMYELCNGMSCYFVAVRILLLLLQEYRFSTASLSLSVGC